MAARLPGGITVSQELLREADPDLDARVIAHIEKWRDSVETGTSVTVDRMLNCNSSCGCPSESLLTNCKGPRPNLPVQIVLEHLFPGDGPCAIKGVVGLAMHGPMIEHGLGLPRFIEKIA